jgi:hypothetical protein
MDIQMSKELTEEEMRLALFGSTIFHESSTIVQIHSGTSAAQSLPKSLNKKKIRSFIPKLKVTLSVGNEFEGDTELFIYEADTLSTLQAELEAKKKARKKYKFIEVVSVKPAI